MNKINRKNINNLIGVSLFLMACISMFLIVRTAFGDDIWYDEVFSLNFAKKSFWDIVSLTAKDVHPPLYYFYLKIVTTLLSFLAPGMSFIVCAKMASVIPWMVIMILAVTIIRKKFGIITAGLFALLVSSMPQIGYYYVEVRMYAFALLLITISFMALIGIIDDSSKKVNWIVFFVAGILTAYTQYYALIGVIGLYIVLFVHQVINKNIKDKKIYVMAVLSIIMYVPWIPSLLNQMANVSESYWIQPLTLRSILGCVKYMFLPSGWGGIMIYAITALMICVTILVLVMFFIMKPSKRDMLIGMSGIIVLGTVILSGFVLSWLNRPIFVYRYMIPVLGVFYLSLAFMLGRVVSKYNFLVVLIIIYAVGGYYTTDAILNEENNKLEQSKNAMQALESIPEGSVIITNFDHVTALMDYYKENCDIYLYEGELDPLVEYMFNRHNQTMQRSQIENLVATNQNVYFFGSFNSRDEILEDWSSLGITSNEQASILIERYWINIWELKHDGI